MFSLEERVSCPLSALHAAHFKKRADIGYWMLDKYAWRKAHSAWRKDEPDAKAAKRFMGFPNRNGRFQKNRIAWAERTITYHRSQIDFCVFFRALRPVGLENIT